VNDSAQRIAGARLDVSGLPTYGYSHRSLMWWGTFGMMLIEATVFALAVFTYFYVRTRVPEWPPGVAPPDLKWGTVNTVIMLASVIPNYFTKRAAERENVMQVRIGMIVCVVFSLAFLGVRVLEFQSLNCRWDTNAYGSAVWMLLGLHTFHLVTDAVDSIVLTALMFKRELEGKFFVDISESAMYWYFVVFAWVPIYAVIYLASRSL
jgi:cytochrome c oxidase subunit 3